MPLTQREKHHPARLLAGFKNTRLKGGREEGHRSGRREPAPPALGSMGGQRRGIWKGRRAKPDPRLEQCGARTIGGTLEPSGVYQNAPWQLSTASEGTEREISLLPPSPPSH